MNSWTQQNYDGAKSFVLFWLIVAGGWLVWERWIIHFNTGWYTFIIAHWQYQAFWLALYLQYLILRRRSNELG